MAGWLHQLFEVLKKPDKGVALVLPEVSKNPDAPKAGFVTAFMKDQNLCIRLTNGDIICLRIDYQYVEDIGNETTTSATPQIKATLITPALTGRYRVSWMCLAQTDGDFGEYRLRNTTDGLDQTGVEIMKPSDSDVVQHVYGFDEITFAGVAKTFQIQWNDGGGGGHTTEIREARIEIWKVAP